MEEHEMIEKIYREQPERAKLLRTTVEDGVVKTNVPKDVEGVVVVAAPSSGGIAWAKQVRCENCNAICWIAPSTQKMIEEHTKPVRLRCFKCVW